MKTKGIISDMDGVILDTEKLYVRFWREAASFYGFPMTLEHALGIRSLSGKLAEEKLQGWFGKEFDYNAVRQKRIELMDEFVNQNGVEPKPGAKALLSYIKDNGYALALATATPV
ncbi:MAG: HAD family phosphatase, partial [Ruminococcus sp.]|nr:HAD family phosphatase [Ruminococcus sp.]